MPETTNSDRYPHDGIPLLPVKTEAPVTDVLPRCTLALEGSETVDALVGRRMGR